MGVLMIRAILFGVYIRAPPISSLQKRPRRRYCSGFNNYQCYGPMFDSYRTKLPRIHCNMILVTMEESIYWPLFERIYVLAILSTSYDTSPNDAPSFPLRLRKAHHVGAPQLQPTPLGGFKK